MNEWLGSDSPECISRVLILTLLDILTVKARLVQTELLLAFLVCDTLGLFKVHLDGACGRCTHGVVGSAEYFLLHLLCVHTLSDRSVTFAIIAVKALLDPAFFLLARSAAESITEDVFAFD